MRVIVRLCVHVCLHLFVGVFMCIYICVLKHMCAIDIQKTTYKYVQYMRIHTRLQLN